MAAKKLPTILISILGVLTIGFSPLLVRAAGVQAGTNPKTGTLALTLEAGNYSLLPVNGMTQISMQNDFGTFSAPGEPQLPGRSFYIVLPPGAKVTHVSFATPQVANLVGTYTLVPAGPVVTDGESAAQARAQWKLAQRHAYASDAAYPASVGEYSGQGQWRAYTLAQIVFQPFQYHPLSGALRFYPHLNVTIDYHLPDPGTPAWNEVQRLRGDHVLDDLIANEVVNFSQAQAWYAGVGAQPMVMASAFDYVIVVQNDTVAAAFAPFVTWKQSLGHSVRVVTLTWIEANYTGVDRQEKLWNFLHDKYPASAWGIRYVMLVGDLIVVPTRRVYYADQGWGLRSDHFYAKLSGGATAASVWNHDGDVRWGELHDDEMTLTPDVLVGRIPLNQVADITNAMNAMIDYEQDNGGWKHNALLAAGYNDMVNATKKTDNAVLMEMIKNNLLDPNGWSYNRLYEEMGLGTSTYTPPPDGEADTNTVVASWNANNYGLVLLANHGNADGLSGKIWQYDSGTLNQVDDGELVWKDLFLKSDAASVTNPHTPVVALFGCASIILDGPPWPDPDTSMAKIGTYTDNTGSALMAHGAAAGVIGFSSPVPYASYWSTLSNGEESTAGYYIAENLIQNHYNLGWSVFEAKIRYTNNFYKNNYEPFHWALNLYGDPSMVLEGYDNSAKGTNKTIYTGPVYAYGADYDDNGDMYVAVSTQPSTAGFGLIDVYRSQDHGSTWSLYSMIGSPNGILAVDLIVGNSQYGEFATQVVNVFFSDTAGNVYDELIDMSAPSTGSVVLVASEGSSANVVRLSAARDPVPMTSPYNLYLAWETTSGSSHTVKVALSTVNGTTWTNQTAFSGFSQPHIDAGPDGHVYLTAIGDAFPNDVSLKRSLDYGYSWGEWKNLTTGDTANYHAVPAVGASSDAAIPTVWVAYNFYKSVSVGGVDLRFAYSTDGGDNWSLDLPLSVERGVDEINPDLADYRTGPSRWMNLAYDNDQSTGTQVFWRWSSGSTPNTWWAPRAMNDHVTQEAIGPQVIYSPGAPISGSGVVYPGTGSPIANLYFSAPWLTASGNALPTGLGSNSATRQSIPSEAQPDLSFDQAGISLFSPPVWQPVGSIPKAFRVGSLASNQAGLVFAAATTSVLEAANTGAVFVSADKGATWSPTQAMPDAWWLDSLMVTHAGTLLAGGIAYQNGVPGAQPQGVIYRSTNNGAAWTMITKPSNTTVVHTLFQRSNGQIMAGTGSSGLILVSTDGGQNWSPMGLPEPIDQVYALWETADGTLYAGGALPGGHGIILRLVNGSWQNFGSSLSGIAAVYSLSSQGAALYAGVSTEAGLGQVIWSSNGGLSWLTASGLPASRAVRSLLSVSGAMFAGLDVGDGLYTTSIFSLWQGSASWQSEGALFMADSVNSLLQLPGNLVFAATGNMEGLIFGVKPPTFVFLPLLRR